MTDTREGTINRAALREVVAQRQRLKGKVATLEDENRGFRQEVADLRKQRRSNGDKMPGGITGKGWRPGQSGNPKGRERKPGIKHMLRDMAIEPLTLEQPDGTTVTKARLHWLLETAWVKAIAGDVHWGREILQRIFGKVRDELALTVGDLDSLVKQITEVVREHVDEQTAAKIGKALEQLSLPGES